VKRLYFNLCNKDKKEWEGVFTPASGVFSCEAQVPVWSSVVGHSLSVLFRIVS